jgi:multidrug efflux pump subunit AcrB
VDLGTGSLGSLRQILDELDVEDGESVRLLGEAAELKRSFPQLLLVLGIAVLLVFLTIAAIFESFRTPLLIMMTIPMAVAGAAMLLWGCRQSLNIMSFMGVILLTGIVVNNSIVLLYRANQFLRQGSDRRAAVLDAARERFRPIILTTLTTLSGMLPMALLGGDGVELRRAMSLTVVGGLFTALAASLLLLPVLYLEFSGRRGLSLSK